MKTHRLKSWPEQFAVIEDGSKPFDIRHTIGRTFAVGDVVTFCEFDDKKGVFTGREVMRRITFVQHGLGPGAIAPLRGIQINHCVLGLASEEGE